MKYYKFIGIRCLYYNLHYIYLQLIVIDNNNNDITIGFEYYYKVDTYDIIHVELLNEEIFINKKNIAVYLRPFCRYKPRIIQILNKY